MPSRFILLANLICASILGLCSTARADSLATSPFSGPLNMRGVSTPLVRPSSATAAPSVAAADYRGTVIVNVEAANRSAIPTNAKIVCSVMVYTYFPDQMRVYTSTAQVTPSTVRCTVTAAYKFTTSTPETTHLLIAAVITNTAVTQSNPFPQGFGFVEIDPPGIPLPPDGTVTTRNIFTII
jgi:hypothetical protein